MSSTKDILHQDTSIHLNYSQREVHYSPSCNLLKKGEDRFLLNRTGTAADIFFTDSDRTLS